MYSCSLEYHRSTCNIIIQNNMCVIDHVDVRTEESKPCGCELVLTHADVRLFGGWGVVSRLGFGLKICDVQAVRSGCEGVVSRRVWCGFELGFGSRIWESCLILVRWVWGRFGFGRVDVRWGWMWIWDGNRVRERKPTVLFLLSFLFLFSFF